MKTIDNLCLIDRQEFTFIINGQLIPEVEITEESNIIKVPKFEINENAYQLIIFGVVKVNNIHELELLIYQKVDITDNNYKFNIVYPLDFSIKNEYLIKIALILEVPDLTLKPYKDEEIKNIIEVSHKYRSSPIDQNFIDNFMKEEHKSNIDVLFNIPKSRNYPNKKSMNIIYFDNLSERQDKQEKEEKLHIIPDFSSIVLATNTFVVPNIKEIVGEEDEILGRGSYGKVYRTTKNLAVKEFENKTNDILFTTLRKIAILRYLKHPNIINIFVFQFEPNSVAMPIATGTLKNYQFTNVEHRKFIFYQIFNGLNYIHSKQVWHLDIKPDNILIFEEYKNSTGYVTLAKITDFGISLFRPVVGKSHTDVATLYWKAPELLLYDDYYTETVDIWGMGVMLLEQILGINIMISISETDLLFRIFRLLGTPNKNSWKGITSYRKWKSNYPVYERSLEKIFNIEFESDEIKKEIDEIIDFENPEKKESSKNFNEELIDNSNHIKINISEDEYEILFHTLTWPTKRYTADKILKLHYWNSIKDEINIRIPTKPLNESYMIKEQKQITVKKWHKSQSRKIYYNLLWRMGTYLKIEKKAIFYTYYLLDLLGEKTTIEKETRITYCVTMLKIVNDFLTNDYVGADGYINAFQYITKTNNISFIEKDLEYEVILETQYKILTLLDFKLCYPISVDFIDKYVKYDNIDITRETYPKKDIVKDLKIEKVKYDAILYYLYSLTLNYRYAILYTQEQLAQLAIRAADVNIPELENIPNLYTDEIREYLLEV